MVLFKALVKQNHDFTVDEYMSIDSESVQYARTDAEIRERWRKQVKFQLLNYINSGKSMDEAREKVLKKYELVAKEIDKYTEEKQYSLFVNAVAMALDPHSNYMDPDELQDFKINMGLKLEGIGAVLRSEDGFVYVENLIPGGPASRLQGDNRLEPNDKIVTVTQANGDAQDIIDVPLRDAVKLIRGEKGTQVRLTIIREDKATGKSTTRTIAITRDEIVLDQQAAKGETREHVVQNSTFRIGYIRLPQFYQEMSRFRGSNAVSSSADMLKLISQLRVDNVQGMIIDLRGNPGGALSDAVNIAGFFIPEGPIVQIKSHNRIEVENDRNPGMAYDGPIVVLVDKLSASASEIFAGAMKDYRRGIVLGPTPTFGKGTVQNVSFQSERLGALKTTTHIFYQPAGMSNHLHGISPDIVIPDLTQALDIGEDKLRYPLPWQPIPGARFYTFGERYVNPAIINTLSALSRQRIAADAEFVELNRKIAEMQKKLEAKTISLKKDSDEDISKEVLEQQKERMRPSDDAPLIDFSKDIFLREAFNVTSDYIRLLQRK
jgi:carboxyl-terminal processing protease